MSSPRTALDPTEGEEPLPPGIEERLIQAGASLAALEQRVAEASAEGDAGPDQRAVLTSLALAVDHMVRELETQVDAAGGSGVRARPSRPSRARRALSAATDAPVDGWSNLDEAYRADVIARVRALRSRLEDAAGSVLVLTGGGKAKSSARRPISLLGRLRLEPDGARSAGDAPPVAGSARAPDRAAQHSGIERVAIAGKILTIVGICLAVFFAFEFVLTPLEMSRAQRSLLAEFRAAQASGALDHAPFAPGAPVALLQIPKLGLDRVVSEGTSPQQLKDGPGHLPGTSLPGEFGNSVLAGHRTTYGGPFRRLNELQSGDEIDVTDGYGAYTYRVTRVLVVRPGQPDAIGPTLDSRLTLFTSDPAFTATHRLAVVATLVGVPANVNRRPSQPVAPSALGTSGDPVGLLVALFWGALLALAVVLARRFRRSWPPVATYLAFVPVVMTLAWLVCENLDRVFPATL